MAQFNAGGFGGMCPPTTGGENFCTKGPPRQYFKLNFANICRKIYLWHNKVLKWHNNVLKMAQLILKWHNSMVPLLVIIFLLFFWNFWINQNFSLKMKSGTMSEFGHSDVLAPPLAIFCANCNGFKIYISVLMNC